MNDHFATAEMLARLERIGGVLGKQHQIARVGGTGATDAELKKPCVELPWEDGLVDWFASTPRVVDWSFFARPLGDFGGGVPTGDQRTLYYLQAMSPLTASMNDLILISSSSMSGQEDLFTSWWGMGLLSESVLTRTYVVDDLGIIDASLAGDTATAISYSLRRGDAVGITSVRQWLNGQRHLLPADELVQMFGHRRYTSPLRGWAHEWLARSGIRMATNHPAASFPGRAALFPSRRLESAAEDLLPRGYVVWRVSDAVEAARQLLETGDRVYVKAEGVGSSSVVSATREQDCAELIEALVSKHRFNLAVGTGRRPGTGDVLDLPLEVACDVTSHAKVIAHVSIQLRVAAQDGRTVVHLLGPVTKYAGFSFSHATIDESGRGVLAEHAAALAGVAVAIRPPSCETLSLEGFLLDDGSRAARLRLIEANLRLAGSSQVALAAHRVAITHDLALPERHWVVNLPTEPDERANDIVDRVSLWVGPECVVTVLGREHPRSAKVLVVCGANDFDNLTTRLRASCGPDQPTPSAVYRRGSTVPRT